MDELIKDTIQNDELTEWFERLKDEVSSLNYYINKKNHSISVISAMVKSIDDICERISIIRIDLSEYYSAEEMKKILGSTKNKKPNKTEV